MSKGISYAHFLRSPSSLFSSFTLDISFSLPSHCSSITIKCQLRKGAASEGLSPVLTFFCCPLLCLFLFSANFLSSTPLLQYCSVGQGNTASERVYMMAVLVFFASHPFPALFVYIRHQLFFSSLHGFIVAVREALTKEMCCVRKGISCLCVLCFPFIIFPLCFSTWMDLIIYLFILM